MTSTTDNAPGLRTRILDAISRRGRGLTIANIWAQGGIIVTGGVVRLSGSGLGCSTWPQCEPGTFTPEFSAAAGWHPFIEFGNRLLTFVLLIAAAGVAIAIWRRRPDMRLLGLVPLIGVIVQAVLGGILVIDDLNPYLVAPHLLISIVLVWVSVQIALRYRQAPRRAGRCLKLPLRASALLLAVLMVMGALTTGAGPHSGDFEQTVRLALDPARVAQVHALSVWAFIVVLAWIVWKVRHDRSAGPRDEVRRAWVVLAAITLAQGAVGYVQYFTGLPEVLVGIHLAGAAALTAAHSAAYYLLSRDKPTPAVAQ
ncbi:MAG: COX15/CtaA family protein [Demequina sp.]